MRTDRLTVREIEDLLWVLVIAVIVYAISH